MKKRLRKFGMFVGGTVFGCSLMLTSVSFADGGIIKFIVNGLDLTPTNGKYNNEPAAIVQNGTTYVPIRLVSNMLDVPIKWDGGTHSIIIGDEIKGTYLSDKNPSYIYKEENTYDSKIYLNQNEMKINGKEYGTKGISIDNAKKVLIRYDLNGKYSKLSLYLGIDDIRHDVSNSYPQQVSITGDGQTLWEGLLLRGADAERIELDLKGIQELELIVEKDSTMNGIEQVDFARAILQ